MKFINKWYFIIWIIIIMASFLYVHSSTPTFCWDELYIDEEKLMQDCNVTLEEYYYERREINRSFCPEGGESFIPTGDCEGAGLPGYIFTIIFASIIYHIIYLAVYSVFKKKIKNKT